MQSILNTNAVYYILIKSIAKQYYILIKCNLYLSLGYFDNGANARTGGRYSYLIGVQEQRKARLWNAFGGSIYPVNPN